MRITWINAGVLQLIDFDASVSESHTSSSSVTSHPVEKGSNISDHVHHEPQKIAIQAMVSDTPIRQPGSHMGTNRGVVAALVLTQARALVPKIGGSNLIGTVLRQSFAPTPTATVLQFAEPVNRVRAVYNELTNLERNGTLVTIETSLVKYEDMVLQNITTPRDVDNSNAVTFQFDAVKIRQVSTSTVEVTSIVKKKKKKGDQSKEKVEPEGKKKSIAAKAADLLAKFSSNLGGS